MPERIIGVVVTHRRRELLASSLKVLTTQTRPLDHLVVVDNADESDVRALVDDCSIPTTYIGSAHNLGGAGGFALGMLLALSLGADRVWLADDDGRPEGPEVLSTLLDCAIRHNLAEVSPVVCDISEPDKLAFPLRRGVEWRRRRSELGEGDLLPGIASLFNGALFTAEAIENRWRSRFAALRPWRRGGGPSPTDPFRTSVRHMPTDCVPAPRRRDEFKPILGGRMHTQYPDNETKRSTPIATVAIYSRNPGCDGSFHRNGCDSVGTSSSPGVTSPGCASG